jgi:hypothetical protein
MTYKPPKAIAAEEIKMTKLTLRHIFLYSELPSLGQNESANRSYYSRHSRKRASRTGPDQNPRYDPAGDLTDFLFETCQD